CRAGACISGRAARRAFALGHRDSQESASKSRDVRAESFGHRRDQSALRIGDREGGPAEARSNGCVRESRLDRRSESRGSIRPRRDRSVPASRSRALADWQRCCTARVPGGGNERPARQSPYGVVRPAGRASGARGWKLSVQVKDHWMVTHGKANPSDASVMLTELLSGSEIRKVTGPIELKVRSIAYDSRKVTAGGMFFALHGEKLDGVKFVSDALGRGASVVASEEARLVGFPKELTWVELLPGSERRDLARAAASFYHQPATALKLVGVTGTNGKTTTTFLVDSILKAAGLTGGLIGTIGYRTPQGSRPALNTTPESLDLQQMFAEIRDAGGTHAVLEASSHALAMDRLWGCHFAAAVFTNLTRDHLDYHKTFEEYFAAKRLLFEGTGVGAPAVAVLNADDDYATRLEGLARRTLTYGLKNAADLTPKKLSLSS